MIVSISGMPLEIVTNEFRGDDGKNVKYTDLIFYEYEQLYPAVNKIRLQSGDEQKIVTNVPSRVRCDCRIHNGRAKMSFIDMEPI